MAAERLLLPSLPCPVERSSVPIRFLQAEVLGEGKEVPVGVKQGQSVLDAARGDQGIDRLAGGDAEGSEQAVLRRLDREVVIDEVDVVGREMTNPPNRRLFVALWPNDELRVALTRARDRWTWADRARPTPVANLHVTLVFLGAVPASDVVELIAALPVLFEPFVLKLDRHALWDDRIAALEPIDECPALTALQGAIAERTAALNYPREPRRFRPHVTIARDAQGSLASNDDEAIQWPISEYALIESRGGRYSTAASWRL